MEIEKPTRMRVYCPLSAVLPGNCFEELNGNICIKTDHVEDYIGVRYNTVVNLKTGTKMEINDSHIVRPITASVVVSEYEGGLV